MTLARGPCLAVTFGFSPYQSFDSFTKKLLDWLDVGKELRMETLETGAARHYLI